MERKQLTVQNISCEHCVRTIESELGEIEGVFQVEADVESGIVDIQFEDPVSIEEIEEVLDDIGFPVDQS